MSIRHQAMLGDTISRQYVKWEALVKVRVTEFRFIARPSISRIKPREQGAGHDKVKSAHIRQIPQLAKDSGATRLARAATTLMLVICDDFGLLANPSPLISNLSVAA